MRISLIQGKQENKKLKLTQQQQHISESPQALSLLMGLICALTQEEVLVFSISEAEAAEINPLSC